MTLHGRINEILLATPAVTDIVADRIKPPGNWQRLARPYIVHFGVALRPIYTHGTEKAALQTWDSYQFSFFGSSYGQVRTLAEVVKSTLSGHHAGVHFFVVNENYDYETDVDIHHLSVDFRVSEALAA